MLNKDIIASMLAQVSEAIGVTLPSNRVGIYYERLKDLPYSVLRKTVDWIIENWESASNFPTVGVFYKKAREYMEVGYDGMQISVNLTEQQIKEVLDRQQKWLNMSSEEYQKMLVEMHRKKKVGA